MECLLGGLTMVLLPGVLFSVAVVVVARKVGHYFDREFGLVDEDDLPVGEREGGEADDDRESGANSVEDEEAPP